MGSFSSVDSTVFTATVPGATSTRTWRSFGHASGLAEAFTSPSETVVTRVLDTPFFERAFSTDSARDKAHTSTSWPAPSSVRPSSSS